MNVVEKIKNFIFIRAVAIYGENHIKKYLSQSKKADKVSEKMLLKLMKKNRNTEFGKKYDFANINSIEEYQKKVPYTTYEDYQEYLDRTAETGEQNLITSDKICFFAKTSGTTGVTKRIPVVDDSYKPYMGCVSYNYTLLLREMKRKGVSAGKGLNTTETECTYTKGGIREGFISSYALSSTELVLSTICLPKEIYGYGDNIDMKYIKARYSLQDADLIFLMSIFMSNLCDLMKYIFDNYQMLVNDIRTGTIDESIHLLPDLREKLEKNLVPAPERAEQLKQIFVNEPNEGIIPKLWKKMSLIVSIGTGEFTPFTEKMKYYCGDDIAFSYGMYAASEAAVATAINKEDKDYLLAVDGAFFEFLPIDNENSTPLLLHQLEVGKLYEVIITNRSGLYRYRIKDVIRVTGYYNKTPLLQFAYRKEQLINITGVKLTIEHITTAIKNFQKQIGVSISDYSLYTDTDFTPWRIVAFIEFDKDIPKNMESEVRGFFDEELTKVNAEYGRMLKIGECSNSFVCSVKKGTYAEYRKWKIKNGASENQVKTVRFIDTKEKLDFFKSRTEHYYN